LAPPNLAPPNLAPPNLAPPGLAPWAASLAHALVRSRAELPSWFCIAAGLAVACAGWAAHLALFGVSRQTPFITFIPAVSLAALAGPPAMGTTAAAASALIVLSAVAPVQSGRDVAALALFVLNSALTVGLTELLARVWAESLAQKTRAHALEQLKSAIEDSSDDAIITKTLDGRITSWNPAAERILGYRAEEIVGRPVTLLFPPLRIAEESAILAHVRASARAAHYRTQRMTKDGRTLDVALTISPLRDAEGRVVGASKILRDVTEQTRNEHALRVSEARLRFALEGARAATWQWDCQTMTSSWDPHFFALHGLNPTLDAPSFDNWLASLLEDDRDQAERAVRAALAPGAADYHSEYRVPAPGGGLRWIEIFGRVERDPMGAPMRMSGISLDVTERHAAWEAAEAANRDLARANDSLKRYAYIAAHDLQEPLRKIQQFSDLLATECAGDISGQAAYCLEVMRQSAGRLRVLINKLLTFSEAANRPLSTAPFDLNAVMERVIKTCAAAIEESGAGITIGTLPTLRGDETLVEQVFVNLLTNAIKYRRPGAAPEIALTAVAEGGGVILRFSDNGVGIAKEDQARVFEPFVRLRGTDGIKGAGVGLAICAAVCERHGWRITLESQPGAGAAFRLAIPDSDHVCSGAGASPASNPEPRFDQAS